MFYIKKEKNCWVFTDRVASLQLSSEGGRRKRGVAVLFCNDTWKKDRGKKRDHGVGLQRVENKRRGGREVFTARGHVGRKKKRGGKGALGQRIVDRLLLRPKEEK